MPERTLALEPGKLLAYGLQGHGQQTRQSLCGLLVLGLEQRQNAIRAMTSRCNRRGAQA
jgi:hypothetical protein